MSLEFRAATYGTGIGEAGLAAADLDGDGRVEIVAAAFGGGFGPATYWYVLSRRGGVFRQSWISTEYEDSITGLALGAVDADPAPEIVVGTHREHTGAPGTYVYVLHAGTGFREWRSPVVPGWGTLSLLRLAQVDLDPALDILFAQPGGALSIVDGVTHEATTLLASGVTALDTLPRRGGVRSEIVVGRSDGLLFSIDMVRRTLGFVGHYGTPIHGLAARDVSGDGAADYVFTADRRVSVVDGRRRTLLWQSEPLGSSWASSPPGAHDSLLVADIDQDGRQEIMVNTGRVGVDIYEVTPQ